MLIKCLLELNFFILLRCYALHRRMLHWIHFADYTYYSQIMQTYLIKKVIRLKIQFHGSEFRCKWKENSQWQFAMHFARLRKQ